MEQSIDQRTMDLIEIAITIKIIGCCRRGPVCVVRYQKILEHNHIQTAFIKMIGCSCRVCVGVVHYKKDLKEQLYLREQLISKQEL